MGWFIYKLEHNKGSDMDIRYEIRVRGHLSPEWTAVFKGMEITCLSNGDTALTGFSPDQAALYGLLLRLRDLGLTLISINPINLLGDNMSNLVLVTGATGKIGKEVVKQLVAKGARVRAFIHSRQN